MNKWKRGLERITVIALAAILVGTTVDMSAFTVYAEESMQSGLCEHHTEHTDECGYKEAVEGAPCTFVCDVCEAEEEVTPACTGQETADEPICTCGTDDESIHATNCPAYEAPENPECYCAEECVELNVWCDICGFDYTACKGTDSAVGYGVIASGPCGDNLSWTLDENGTLTISGSGAMEDYNSLYSPKAPWRSAGKDVTTVVIEGDVENIGDAAFSLCSSLTSVTLPDSITSIGAQAFYWCDKLTSITIPAGVTSIGVQAFGCCSSLTEITLPDSVENLGEYAFNDCSKLTSITIPAGVTSIGDDTFIRCSSLTSVTLPDSVESIGAYAFDGCSGLESVTMGNSVKSIGDHAFRSCSKLTSITLPDSVESIGDAAFRSCSSLESVTMGNSVTSIGDEAFRSCSKLTSISIPDSVESIGVWAFEGCSNLCVHYLGTKEQYYTVIKGAYILSGTKGIHYGVSDKPTWTPDVSGSTHSWRCPEEGCGMVLKTEDHINTEVKNAKAATCTAEGYTGDTYCKDCKERTAIGTEIPMKNHTGGTATCTKKAVCSVCGKEYGSVDSSKHGRTEVKGAKEATCTAGGYTGDTYCKDCGVKIASSTTTETLNHSYKDVKVIRKATTKKNGTMNQKCSSCGTTRNISIYAAKTAKLSATSYTYNGKVKKPSVTVTDSKGNKLKNKTDYTVSYAKDRKNVGKYTVTITLKGKYSGTIKKTFTVKPKTTGISKLSAAKKGFTVKWKKQKSQTTGYEIQYSTSSKFTKKTTKTVKITKNSTTSKNIAKLKAKKKYYVRVRTYKTVKVNGKSTKIYSDWSKSKTVTTTKN